jgi:hypothetical protein
MVFLHGGLGDRPPNVRSSAVQFIDSKPRKAVESGAAEQYKQKGSGATLGLRAQAPVPCVVPAHS